MNVTLDDPFINRLAQVMVVIFIAIMVLPCVFAVYFYFNSSGFSTQPSEWARFVVTYLPHDLKAYPLQYPARVAHSEVIDPAHYYGSKLFNDILELAMPGVFQ